MFPGPHLQDTGKRVLITSRSKTINFGEDRGLNRGSDDLQASSFGYIAVSIIYFFFIDYQSLDYLVDSLCIMGAFK